MPYEPSLLPFCLQNRPDPIPHVARVERRRRSSRLTRRGARRPALAGRRVALDRRQLRERRFDASLALPRIAHESEQLVIRRSAQERRRDAEALEILHHSSKLFLAHFRVLPLRDQLERRLHLALRLVGRPTPHFLDELRCERLRVDELHERFEIGTLSRDLRFQPRLSLLELEFSD